jgi:hypothetical protein
MKYAPQENRDQQRFMLNTELARAASDAGYGSQTREQWSALASALKDFAVINKDVDVSQVFTSRFLERVYAGRN